MFQFISYSILLLVYAECAPSPVVVTLPNGRIEGFTTVSKNNVTFYSYVGIPFAAPPIGKLRFQPPQEPNNWTSILEVKSNNKICFQTSSIKAHQTEDCLYINVFSPVAPDVQDKKLPVLVDIYGGAYIHGGAYTGHLKQQYYIERDIVIVSFNYRVGPMGFLTTMDTVLPGNMGLKDQQFALKWLQQNIHLFGGDASKVTLMGTSAGGASATYHMLSTGSAGLFRAAIAQSGSALSTWANQRHPVETAYGIAALIDPSFDRNRSSQDLLDLLQSVTAEDIDKTGKQYGTFAPVVEVDHPEAFITESMYQLAKSGKINEVPLIAGINDEEAIYKAGDLTSWKKTVAHMDRDNSYLADDDMRIDDPAIKLAAGKTIRSIYTNVDFMNNISASIKYESDDRYARPVIKFAELVAPFTDVWFYQFSYHGELGNNSAYVEGAGRVAHSENGPYVWTDLYKLEGFPAADKLTSQRFSQLITNFVKELTPTPMSDPLFENITWPKVSSSTYYYLNLNDTLSIQTDPKKETFEQWVKIYEEYAAKPLLSF